MTVKKVQHLIAKLVKPDCGPLFLLDAAVITSILVDKIWGSKEEHSPTNIMVCWGIVSKYCMEENYVSDRLRVTSLYKETEMDLILDSILVYRFNNSLLLKEWTKMEIDVLQAIDWNIAYLVQSYFDTKAMLE